MNRNIKVIKVSIVGIFTNILLSLFKAIVGIISNSIAIILDAVNNLSDALSSTITIIGTKLSTKQADREHPYGHGRIEYFSAIIISIIVLIAGFVSLSKSIEKIINPVNAKYTISTLLIIVVAMIIKLVLGYYFKKNGKELNSNSLYASGVDAIGDFFISLSTFITAIISIIFKINLEGYVGLFISLIIIKSALDIFKSSINDVIGIRADTSLTKNIKKEILSYNEVLGAHDLSLHNYGPTNIIATVHIDVVDTMKAKEIYRLTRTITNQIYDKFGIILTVGIYASNETKSSLKIKEYIIKLIEEYKNIKEIHGFYVDEEQKSISFDIIFDFKEKKQTEILEKLQQNIKKKYPKYEIIIIIDKDISD